VKDTLYLFFGEDEYQVSTRARALTEKLVPAAEAAFGLELVDGRVDTVDAALRALSACMLALNTRGFFAARKVVWLRDVSFLGENRAAQSETVKARVADLTGMIKAGLPEGAVLVISAGSLDKRSAFYKACEKAGTVAEFAFPEKEWEAKRYMEGALDALLKEEGLSMPGDARAAFIEKTGNDARQAAGELQKLAIYLGARKKVTREDVELLTVASREAITWSLADAVGTQDLTRALSLVRQLLFQKEAPTVLAGIIEARLRDLMVFREAIDREWLHLSGGGSGKPPAVSWKPLPPEVEKAYAAAFKKDPRKEHPFRAGLLAAQAQKFPAARLRRCQKHAVEAHASLLTTMLPPPLVLETLLFKMLA
jgi:DNA polymerase-3 subunit delta